MGIFVYKQVMKKFMFRYRIFVFLSNLYGRTRTHTFVHSHIVTAAKDFQFYSLKRIDEYIYTHKTFIGRNGIQFASLFAVASARLYVKAGLYACV